MQWSCAEPAKKWQTISTTLLANGNHRVGLVDMNEKTTQSVSSRSVWPFQKRKWATDESKKQKEQAGLWPLPWPAVAALVTNGSGSAAVRSFRAAGSTTAHAAPGSASAAQPHSSPYLVDGPSTRERERESARPIDSLRLDGVVGGALGRTRRCNIDAATTSTADLSAPNEPFNSNRIDKPHRWVKPATVKDHSRAGQPERQPGCVSMMQSRVAAASKPPTTRSTPIPPSPTDNSSRKDATRKRDERRERESAQPVSSWWAVDDSIICS